MATYDLKSTAPNYKDIAVGDILNCSYSGVWKSITLPAGSYKLECWGAQGGSYNSTYAAGGLGGYSYGTLTLKKPTALFIYVGKQGSAYTTSTYTSQGGGGFNGGGGAGYYGGGGGGATDIRIASINLYSRIIVAGGGGGAYAYSSTYQAAGGAGGGTSGSAGSTYSSSYSAFAGGGGTQTAGGAAGTGSSTNYNGNAGSFGSGGSTGYKYNSTSYYSNGGGGGGWYGGGGAGNYSSTSRTRGAGGGGGSGYIYTESTKGSYPSRRWFDKDLYLTDAATSSGVRSGDGYATITVLSLAANKYIKTTTNGILPSGYTLLPYIETSLQGQYIDTGFYPTNNTRVIIDIETTPQSLEVQPIYGARNTVSTVTTGSNAFIMWKITHLAFRSCYNTTNKTISELPGGRVIIDQNKNYTTIHDTTIQHDSGTFNCTVPLLLFTVNNNGDATVETRYGSLRCYSCQIYENNVLQRNYVPAMRNSDSEIGLYDLKNNVFYTDARGVGFLSNTSSFIDNNTVFLLDGTSLTDATGKNTVTNTGVVVSTDDSCYGTSSLYFDGSSYLTINNTSIIPTTGDWTIDWWEKKTEYVSASASFSIKYSSDTSVQYGIMNGYTSTSANARMYISTTGTSWSYVGSGNTEYNKWVHRAVVRHGGKIMAFKNGALMDSIAVDDATALAIAQNMTIGMYMNSSGVLNCMKGYIDQFRISNCARWSARSTSPPTKEYGNPWCLIHKTYLKNTSNTWCEEV